MVRGGKAAPSAGPPQSRPGAGPRGTPNADPFPVSFVGDGPAHGWTGLGALWRQRVGRQASVQIHTVGRRWQRSGARGERWGRMGRAWVLLTASEGAAGLPSDVARVTRSVLPPSSVPSKSTAFRAAAVSGKSIRPWGAGGWRCSSCLGDERVCHSSRIPMPPAQAVM